MALRLYNTLSRRKEEFVPLEPGKVRMYSCGLTVYNYAHIGNLRTYIFSDILRRTLEYEGYDVLHVMNVTDVGHLTSDADEGEDKIEKGAREAGKNIWELARHYEEAFWKDLERLNIEKPKIICRATEHIPDMIVLIQRLIERGHAYETDQAVYFDISTFPRYTEFTRQPLEQKVIGARDEVKEDPAKRHPADFALWFKAVGRFENHIMRWDSPWGVGFPGWHIECSAMAMKYLGETLDIHTGGEDHIWVHHPNEIAQSEAATGKQFVRFWMHGAFLIVADGEGSSEERRMGKSEGNFITLQTLINKGYDPLAYRYACLMAHYRQKLRFSWESLDAAASGYSSIKEFAARAKQIGGDKPPWLDSYRERFKEAIEDDLNMPQAMAAVCEMIREAETRKEYGVLDALYDFDRVLGLGFRESVEAATAIDPHVESLIREREEARRARNFARADEIRSQLAQQGIVLEDTLTGTIWRRTR
ncbi:MAG: cysteine--tRNA ligase [Armatimonadota bacterium]